MMVQNPVIPCLISQIFIEKVDSRFTKTHLHKILFKLKMSLPEDDPVRDCLPFYWYNFGPYSDVIESTINGMVSSKSLNQEVTRTNKVLLSLANSDFSCDLDLEDAIKRLSSVLKHVNVYHMKPFIDNIYREYAPFDFMPLFKIDFLDNMAAFMRQSATSQSTLDEFFEPYNSSIDDIENILYDCETEIPALALFDEYGDLFSSYVTASSKIFEYIRKDSEHTLCLGKEILNNADNVWFTFTKGVRIPKEGHDKYYNKMVDIWYHQYNQSLSDTLSEIDNYSEGVINYAKENCIKHKYANKANNIIPSIVKGYFT